MYACTIPRSGRYLIYLYGQTEKRDVLRAIEKKYQKLWQQERVFESDAPSCAESPPGDVSVEELWAEKPKFFGQLQACASLILIYLGGS